MAAAFCEIHTAPAVDEGNDGVEVEIDSGKSTHLGQGAAASRPLGHVDVVAASYPIESRFAENESMN